MPVALLLIGSGVFVTGIYALAMHNSVSKSNSKSTSRSNILSEIEETKKSLDEEIKRKLLQGTVTIVVYIQYRQQIKQQHEEMIRAINIFPEIKVKELEDYILWAGGNEGATNPKIISRINDNSALVKEAEKMGSISK